MHSFVQYIIVPVTGLLIIVPFVVMSVISLWMTMTTLITDVLRRRKDR